MSFLDVARRDPWDEGGCFAVDYVPGSIDDPRWHLVKALKSGDVSAGAVAALMLARGVDMRGRSGSVSLVAVPGHAAAINRSTETLCARLASVLPGVRHRPGALQRLRPIRCSATAVVRPTIDEHLDTLRMTVPVRGSVIIVDDVFTHGRVTEAGTRLLREAGATEVIVAAVARTRI